MHIPKSIIKIEAQMIHGIAFHFFERENKIKMNLRVKEIETSE